MRRKYFRKRYTRVQKITAGCIAFLVVWFLLSTAHGVYKRHVVETVTLSGEPTETTLEAYGFLDMMSDLLYAKGSGDVEPIVQEGDRVSANGAVFRVKGEKEPVLAPRAGMVSYHVHGYEDVHNLDSFSKIDMTKLYESERSAIRQTRYRAEEGKPVAKVVDNLSAPNLFVRYNPEQNHVFSQVGDTLYVRFIEEDYKTWGTVTDMRESDDGMWLAKIALQALPDAVSKKDALKVSLFIVSETEWSLAPTTIVYKDGAAGIYMLDKRRVRWVPIEVTSETPEAIICTPLANPTTIITNPKKVREGDLL